MYFFCDSGYPNIEYCPNGLFWNNDLQMCDSQDNVICEQTFSECLPGDIIPNIYEPTSFLVCADGQYLLIPCAPGLFWNPILNACDWPPNVDYGKAINASVTKDSNEAESSKSEESEESDASESSCNNGDYLIGFNCSTFYHCIDGVPVLLSCPSKLRWNQKSKVCDLPENVQCTEESLFTGILPSDKPENSSSDIVESLTNISDSTTLPDKSESSNLPAS